ncbi:hypothetical protein SESBI_03075 [Sesbania bispinosa]|nr:hypothetical protein SESBI_03075 [Sesbania bispinosa]
MEDLTRNLTRAIKEGFDDIKREIGGELRENKSKQKQEEDKESKRVESILMIAAPYATNLCGFVSYNRQLLHLLKEKAIVATNLDFNSGCHISTMKKSTTSIKHHLQPNLTCDALQLIEHVAVCYGKKFNMNLYSLGSLRPNNTYLDKGKHFSLFEPHIQLDCLIEWLKLIVQNSALVDRGWCARNGGKEHVWIPSKVLRDKKVLKGKMLEMKVYMLPKFVCYELDFSKEFDFKWINFKHRDCTFILVYMKHQGVCKGQIQIRINKEKDKNALENSASKKGKEKKVGAAPTSFKEFMLLCEMLDANKILYLKNEFQLLHLNKRAKSATVLSSSHLGFNTPMQGQFTNTYCADFVSFPLLTNHYEVLESSNLEQVQVGQLNHTRSFGTHTRRTRRVACFTLLHFSTILHA